MAAIGIDTHKDSLACCLIDDLGIPLDERTIPNDPSGHARLTAWVRSLEPVPVVGLEGSSSFGAAAARVLASAGLEVREVPAQLSHRERRTTRRAGKSDPGDALAIARVVARERGLPPVRLEDGTTELALLLTARQRLVDEATRVRNAIHAHLLVLLPGYGASAPNLVAASHRRTIRARLRGHQGVRVDLVRRDLDRLAGLMADSRSMERDIGRRVAGHPLLGMPGVGPLVTATILARLGDPRRVRSHGALAMLAGVAPIPASSGQVRRVRLNRGGDRDLNRAFYVIALTQIRTHPPARAYFERKRAEGKSGPEALRSLKRHLVRAVFHLTRPVSSTAATQA
jgi:transposase